MSIFKPKKRVLSKKEERLRHREVWSLREIKAALSEVNDDDVCADIGSSYPAINYEVGGKRSGSWRGLALPQLRTETNTAYSGMAGYEKRVDRFISKYGADARFSVKQDTDKPIKEEPNDAQLEPSKESSSSSSKNRDAIGGSDHPHPQGLGHRAKENSEEGGAFAKWNISLGGVKPGARPKAESPNPPFRGNAFSKSFSSDKVGVSTLPDTSVLVSKGVANPGDRVGQEKELDESDKTRRVNGFSSTPIEVTTQRVSDPSGSRACAMYNRSAQELEPLGDVSSPLNPLSFGTFALSGAKGRRGWGLSNPTTKVSLSDLIGSKTLSDGLDDCSWLKTEGGSGFSRESQFRSGSPGGYVDEHKAQLEKKSVRSQAKKIARHFVGFFRDNEVGIGAEQTPRISGKRLVKELVGKAVRLARTKKEEMGTGLKLIFVDISPSCDAIRDACFAAALAIADEDPDVVVLAHFNGYTARHGGHIVGYRQKEIPHIWDTDDLEKFKAFLAEGKVSGAVCFGDDDAEEVYSLLSHYCPTLWLSPDDEGHCKERMAAQDRRNGRVYDEARMYIVGGVFNAQSAVEGLRKIRRK